VAFQRVLPSNGTCPRRSSVCLDGMGHVPCRFSACLKEMGHVPRPSSACLDEKGRVPCRSATRLDEMGHVSWRWGQRFRPSIIAPKASNINDLGKSINSTVGRRPQPPINPERNYESTALLPDPSRRADHLVGQLRQQTARLCHRPPPDHGPTQRRPRRRVLASICSSNPGSPPCAHGRWRAAPGHRGPERRRHHAAGAAGLHPAALPTRPGPVNTGALNRIFALIQLIKDSKLCTDAIAADLRITGGAQAAPDFNTLAPEFTVHLTAAGVFLDWSWGGYAAFLDMIELQVDRNDGKGWVPLAFDTRPATRTLSAARDAVKWKYRAIFHLGDERVGLWSNEASILVGG